MTKLACSEKKKKKQFIEAGLNHSTIKGGLSGLRQIKYAIFPHSQGPWPPNFGDSG